MSSIYTYDDGSMPGSSVCTGTSISGYSSVTQLSSSTPTSSTKIDKLSLYLERVAANVNSSAGSDLNCIDFARDYVARLLGVIFTEDERFIQTFTNPAHSAQTPNTNALFRRNGSSRSSFRPSSRMNCSSQIVDQTTGVLCQESKYVFRCALYLQRFTQPDACVVYSGSHADLPPGAAVYRVNPALTAEERNNLQRCHPLIIDSEGFVSPAKIFPWFAEGIELAQLRLAKPSESGSDSDQVPHVSLSYAFPVVTLSFDTGTDQELAVHLYPAIHGRGWAPGVRLQHALPRQKPYCLYGRRLQRGIETLLGDGQSLWSLEASRMRLTHEHQMAPRFRAGLQKYGKVERFWKLSFDPAEKLMFNHLVATCSVIEYKIDVLGLKQIFMYMCQHHGWGSINEKHVEFILMLGLKRYLAVTRSFSEAFIRIASFMKICLQKGMCPSLLVPNMNLFADISYIEAKHAAHQLDQLIATAQKDPQSVLSYIGYGKRK